MLNKTLLMELTKFTFLLMTHLTKRSLVQIHILTYSNLYTFYIQVPSTVLLYFLMKIYFDKVNYETNSHYHTLT